MASQVAPQSYSSMYSAASATGPFIYDTPAHNPERGKCPRSSTCLAGLCLKLSLIRSLDLPIVVGVHRSLPFGPRS